MSRRHRGRVARNAYVRAERYRRKFDPGLYKILVEPQLDIINQQIREYQAVHEFLINTVKEILNGYPSEAFKANAYVQAAQGFWYCIVHYTGESAKRCAVEKFVHHKIRGLEEEPLRRIARSIGVILPDWDEILLEYLKAKTVVTKKITNWGIPMVECCKDMPIYIVSDRPGQQIVVECKKPGGGLCREYALDLGDGNYRANIYFDERGAWLLEVRWPDGFVRKKLVYVY